MVAMLRLAEQAARSFSQSPSSSRKMACGIQMASATDDPARRIERQASGWSGWSGWSG
jgi:hypothetical protein